MSRCPEGHACDWCGPKVAAAARVARAADVDDWDDDDRDAAVDHVMSLATLYARGFALGSSKTADRASELRAAVVALAEGRDPRSGR
jgi:hypothetical protein